MASVFGLRRDKDLTVTTPPEGDVGCHGQQSSLALHAEVTEMLQQLDGFRKERLFCDVVLQCEDGRSFWAHKLVLAAMSQYFRAMFLAKMQERHQTVVKLNEVESKALAALLDFCYTSDIKVEMESVFSLITAANMLCFATVEKHCVDFLRRNLNNKNCVDICALADAINCTELKQLAELYVTSNFRAIAQSSSFSVLTRGQLESILSRDDLCVSSETEVYESILTWVKSEASERGHMLASLLQHVRLAFISRKYLADRIMTEGVVMDNADCRTLVLEALNYHLLPERKQDGVYKSKVCLPRQLRSRSLFVVGGEAKKRALHSAESYDFATNQWSAMPSMIMARKNVAAAVLDGTLYAIGGVNHEYTDLVTAEKYDRTTGTWTSVASLSACKGALCAVVLDGWIYAVGGSYQGGALKTVERYDPLTNAWTEVATMRLPRCYFGAAVLNGKIFVTGGYCGISEVEHCECYDPISSKWFEITGMNKSRMYHAVAASDDRIYAIGGKNSLGPLNSIEKFNPDLNMWLVIKSYLGMRTGMCASVSLSAEKDSDELMIIGGSDGMETYGDVQTFQLSTPDYMKSQSISMLQPRAFAGAAIS